MEVYNLQMVQIFVPATSQGKLFSSLAFQKPAQTPLIIVFIAFLSNNIFQMSKFHLKGRINQSTGVLL